MDGTAIPAHRGQAPEYGAHESRRKPPLDFTRHQTTRDRGDRSQWPRYGEHSRHKVDALPASYGFRDDVTFYTGARRRVCVGVRSSRLGDRLAGREESCCARRSPLHQPASNFYLFTRNDVYYTS